MKKDYEVMSEKDYKRKSNQMSEILENMKD